MNPESKICDVKVTVWTDESDDNGNVEPFLQIAGNEVRSLV
jgi:hypothetical protein